jgi:hypothetical protein
MAIYVSTFLVEPDLRLNLSSANQRVQDTSHVTANVCLCLSNNALGRLVRIGRFSEPVKYCLNPRCVRVMWEAGAIGGCGKVRWRCKGLSSVTARRLSGRWGEGNRKFHGCVMAWTELESLIEPYYPKEGSGRTPVGLSIIPTPSMQVLLGDA